MLPPEETSAPGICGLLGIDMAKMDVRRHIESAAAWGLKTTIINPRSCGLGAFPSDLKIETDDMRKSKRISQAAKAQIPLQL